MMGRVTMEHCITPKSVRNMFIFIVLANSSELHSRQESRLYITRYGNLRGMCISLTDKCLCNVEVLSGVEYGTIRRQMLRFMPPVSSLEMWLGNRIFTNISYRDVCPQTNRSDLEYYIRQDKKFENLYKRRSDNMFYHQQDDCLSLNLYIPTTGKINSFCLLILIYIVKTIERLTTMHRKQAISCRFKNQRVMYKQCMQIVYLLNLIGLYQAIIPPRVLHLSA